MDSTEKEIRLDFFQIEADLVEEVINRPPSSEAIQDPIYWPPVRYQARARVTQSLPDPLN